MKRSAIFALVASAFMFVQASAQTTTPSADVQPNRRERMANTTPEQRAERQTQQMKKRLSLKPDQETAVASINLKYAQQMRTLVVDGERNRETMKQVRSLMSSKDDELKKVLDKDQYKQYEDQKAAQKDHMKQGRRNSR